MSPSLIYAVLKSGKLKAMRIGCNGRGCWRVMPDDFDAWLQSCKLQDLPRDNEEYTHMK